MKIVSDKDLRVTTLAGAAIVFQAGEPTTVSDEIGLLALQAGAKEYNGKYIEEKGAEDAVFEEVIQAPVEAISPVLTTVLERMMDEGDPKNFKADGDSKSLGGKQNDGRNDRHR